jgi:CRP/FNR family transcriptional regulator
VKRLLGSLPELAAAILNYLLIQDQERISRIEMLTLYDVEHRILHVLAELAQLVKPNADGLSYPIPITQLELASLVGATRETTSSMLSILQTRNLVTLGRRMVTSVEPKMLIDAANNKLTQAKSTP